MLGHLQELVTPSQRDSSRKAVQHKAGLGSRRGPGLPSLPLPGHWTEMRASGSGSPPGTTALSLCCRHPARVTLQWMTFWDAVSGHTVLASFLGLLSGTCWGRWGTEPPWSFLPSSFPEPRGKGQSASSHFVSRGSLKNGGEFNGEARFL